MSNHITASITGQTLPSGGAPEWLLPTSLYDEISIPENLSYNTRRSFALQLAASINWRIAEKPMMNVSTNYNHISNGAMKQPNIEINYPNASIGFDYYIRRTTINRFSQTDWCDDISPKTRYLLSVFATSRDMKIDARQKKSGCRI